MRGEYSRVSCSHVGKPELPPRARRIQINVFDLDWVPGTTSACAENTCQPVSSCSYTWNYLRVRGEYGIIFTPPHAFLELPPRARRIPSLAIMPIRALGTTSACAENTMVRKTERTPSWNYLRVRGEYNSIEDNLLIMSELPPRARRIRATWVEFTPPHGTTSACAENTWCSAGPRGGAWNYLRVRGEYFRRTL